MGSVEQIKLNEIEKQMEEAVRQLRPCYSTCGYVTKGSGITIGLDNSADKGTNGGVLYLSLPKSLFDIKIAIDVPKDEVVACQISGDKFKALCYSRGVLVEERYLVTIPFKDGFCIWTGDNFSSEDKVYYSVDRYKEF